MLKIIIFILLVTVFILRCAVMGIMCLVRKLRGKEQKKHLALRFLYPLFILAVAFVLLFPPRIRLPKASAKQNETENALSGKVFGYNGDNLYFSTDGFVYKERGLSAPHFFDDPLYRYEMDDDGTVVLSNIFGKKRIMRYDKKKNALFEKNEEWQKTVDSLPAEKQAEMQGITSRLGAEQSELVSRLEFKHYKEKYAAVSDALSGKAFRGRNTDYIVDVESEFTVIFYENGEYSFRWKYLGGGNLKSGNDESRFGLYEYNPLTGSVSLPKTSFRSRNKFKYDKKNGTLTGKNRRGEAYVMREVSFEEIGLRKNEVRHARNDNIGSVTLYFSPCGSLVTEGFRRCNYAFSDDLKKISVFHDIYEEIYDLDEVADFGKDK